jgi:prepilin-type processing-associated H-X9-DG protein
VSILVTCECGRQYETPDENAGRWARCAACGRELTIPGVAPPVELMVPEESGPAVTSGKAILSLVLGLVFVFACLSGVPAIIVGRDALRDIDRSKGRLRGRRMAIAGVVFGVIGCLFTVAFFLPAFRSAREAARRSQCVNNLKQISLAFLNYHDANGCLPPAAITGPSGRPLLSWRVAILPYLECSSLYAKFHLDEPWDSPHNLSLLERIPNIYACPSDGTLKRGMTGYQAVIGPETAFTPDFTPVRLQDFTDGLSNTLLVGESRSGVPWTRPEDLLFDLTRPLSGLGSFHGYHNNGFNAAFADGSVRFLKSSIVPSVLHALLTRNGNEEVSPDSY